MLVNNVTSAFTHNGIPVAHGSVTVYKSRTSTVLANLTINGVATPNPVRLNANGGMGAPVECEPIAAYCVVKNATGAVLFGYDLVGTQGGGGGSVSLNRTVTSSDGATGSVTDTGGDLSIPVPVTVAAPSASNVQTTAGTKTLRAQLKTLIDNIAYLFTNKQNKLTAGTNITISGDTISATGGEGGVSLNREVALTGKVTGTAQDTGGDLSIATSVNLAASDIPELPQSKITNLTSNLAGKVSTSRRIDTVAPLTGGGNLSSDLTLEVADATHFDKGVIKLAGDLAGTAGEPELKGVARIDNIPIEVTEPEAGETFTVVDDVRSDGKGRVIGIDTKIVRMPAAGGGGAQEGAYVRCPVVVEQVYRPGMQGSSVGQMLSTQTSHPVGTVLADMTYGYVALVEESPQAANGSGKEIRLLAVPGTGSTGIIDIKYIYDSYANNQQLHEQNFHLSNEIGGIQTYVPRVPERYRRGSFIFDDRGRFGFITKNAPVAEGSIVNEIEIVTLGP
jgi:hypothetical protein